MLFFNNDINFVIVQFFNDDEELLNFRKICRITYFSKYCVKFVCTHLSNLYNVEYLDLSNNIRNYTEQDMFNNGQHIRYLICSENTSEQLLKCIPKLKTLKCSFNNTIKDISYLSFLQKLSCGHTLISDFSNLGNLLVLNCDKNYKINDNCFKYLSKLNILTCGISTLTDECLYYLPNLVVLECGINTTFTDNGIVQLKKLKSLECRNCMITSDSINYLTNLEYLKVNKNINLGKLQIPSLIYLDCNENEYITDSSVDTPNLSILLCNTTLTNEFIKKIPKLTYLDLVSNLLINDISCLKELTTLICGINNNINDNSLMNLTNLQYLDCHRAGLNFSDASLPYLNKLNYIYYNDYCKFTGKELKKITTLHHWFIYSKYGYDYIILQ